MEILAIDPGLNMGWARFIDGRSNGLGVINGASKIYDWIAQQRPEYWIVEDYKIRPAKVTGGWDHRWNSVFPAKVIGAIEFHAVSYGGQVILQQPSIKPVAAGRAGLINWDTKKKGQHSMDAYLHGLYYLEVTCKK